MSVMPPGDALGRPGSPFVQEYPAQLVLWSATMAHRPCPMATANSNEMK